MNRRTLFSILTLLALRAVGQTPADSAQMEHDLQEVNVTTLRPRVLRMSGAENGTVTGRQELFRAACCNLGESFVTNPSVDVSYSDAATGARQIRLLGLAGTYVQMLTETLPAFRGAAAPFALGYIPGPWMQSIQVSKGAASVKNGYESMTGQINVEYLKPDADEGVTLNLYGNTQSRFEANADASVRLSPTLSTAVLLHYDKDFERHDANADGFQDQPSVRQWNVQNRWKLAADRYLFHAGVSLLRERRTGGQRVGHHAAAAAPLHPVSPYLIGITTDRYEGYMKHAFIIDPERGSNIALMASAALHDVDALLGSHAFTDAERNLYAHLMYESKFGRDHHLSAGASLNYDRSRPTLDAVRAVEDETTPGAYVQYTFNHSERIVAMAGVRADHSSIYGTFCTPRLHVKLAPADFFTLRLSAGKGYRTPHALAENFNLLATGRAVRIDRLRQEEAWNVGSSAAFYVPLFGKTLQLNAEYYYTRFRRQMVLDYDTDPAVLHIGNLDGRSFSHTFQTDATYPLLEGLSLTAAWRWQNVKTTYGGVLRRKPLTNRYKGLLTASYKTPLGLWQFDATLTLNGSGRMPQPYVCDDGTLSWQPRFGSFEQLSAQVTRWFRHFSVYVGGENLTGVRQHQLIIDAANPWGSRFDPTMVWGPVHGAVGYMGIRINVGRL